MPFPAQPASECSASGPSRAWAERPPRAARADNLPTQPTPLIGREHETAEVRRQLLRADVRLLTLVGPPGIGKTRLGIEAAQGLVDHFERGVRFVPLAPIRDPGLVASVIAHTVGLREAGDRPLSEILAAALREQELLLVLDNFEQVVEAAQLLADLLAACPRLKVLATSRAPLHVYGEFELPVPPLALPDGGRLPTLDELEQIAAVQLFVQRARALRPSFALGPDNASAVAEVCVRLDGLPLAIELAAARVKVLSPQAILARLERRFELLTGGAQDWPVRQRTLREAIGWSWDLLEPREQVLLRRLAVFAGGWTLAAAEAVCAGGEIDSDEILDLLSKLLDRSLVLAEERGGETRYRFLETIREYSVEKLRESGEEWSFRDRHQGWFLALAERSELELWGPEQVAWLDRLDRDLNNLRAALEWSRSAGERGQETAVGGAEAGLRLVGSLYRFWGMRGHASEGRQWVAALLERWHGRTAGAAKALITGGYLAFLQGQHAAVRAFLEEGLAVARELRDVFCTATSLVGLGASAGIRGDFQSADALLAESLPLWQATGFRAGLGMALFWRGEVARLQGEYERAAALLDEALSLAREQRDIYGIAYHLNSLGYLELLLGDPERATALQRESLLLWGRLEDKYGVAQGLAGLGCAASALGLPERAARLLAAAETVEEDLRGAPPAWLRDRERAASAVRAALGEEASAAWTEGRAMSLKQAVEYALAADEARPTAAPEAPASDRRPAGLTERELEVAALVAQGLTSREIAERLVISERTADTHVDHIRDKLGLHSRAQVAAWAVEEGLPGARSD